MYCRDIGVQISLIISLFSMPGLAASSYAYSADEKCGAFLPKGVQDAIYSIIDDPVLMKQHFPEIHGTSDYVFLSGGTFLPTGFFGSVADEVREFLDINAHRIPVEVNLIARDILVGELQNKSIHFRYRTEICGKNFCPFSEGKLERIDESRYEALQGWDRRLHFRKKILSKRSTESEFEVFASLSSDAQGRADYLRITTVRDARWFGEVIWQSLLGDTQPNSVDTQVLFRKFALGWETCGYG